MSNIQTKRLTRNNAKIRQSSDQTEETKDDDKKDDVKEADVEEE